MFGFTVSSVATDCWRLGLARKGIAIVSANVQMPMRCCVCNLYEPLTFQRDQQLGKVERAA